MNATSNGVSFLDLSAKKITIKLGDGDERELSPLSFKRITIISQRFKELEQMADLSFVEIMQRLGPDAMGAVIAAGFGKPDDPGEIEKWADTPLPIQIKLLEQIYALTADFGDGPLARALSEYGGQVRAFMIARAAITAASPNSSAKESELSPSDGAAPPQPSS